MKRSATQRVGGRARPQGPTETSWRGRGADDAEDLTASVSSLLKGRSRRLLGSLLSPHKRALAKAGVLIMVFNASTMAAPYLVMVAIDRGIPALSRHGSPDAWPLAATGIALLVAALAQAGSDRAFNLVTGRVGERVLLELRQRLLAHFNDLSVGFHERYTSGRMISRLTSDVETISELVGTGLESLAWAGLSIVSVSVLLVILSPMLGLVALSVMPVVVALTVWFRGEAVRAYRATRESVALVIVHFVESLGGIKAVQAFHREPRNQEIFDSLDSSYRQANTWAMRLVAVYGPGVRMLGSFSVALVLLVGGRSVLSKGLSVGVLVAALLYLRRIFDPVTELSQFYTLFQSAAAAFEKIAGVLDERAGVPEPAHPQHLPEGTGGIGVALRDVSFAYGQRFVLHDLNLEIEAGQTVALLGATGAGKSTLARLVARFYDPTSGSVLIDGVDLKSLTDADLRRAVVMVTQEGFVFSGSLADNIRFGRPGASMDEIVQAARAIGAHDAFSSLEQGYDTPMNRRGSRLSAGQRQLVAFARAFLSNPRLLVLDEATSALDLPSERRVQDALHRLLAGRTAVIIAHRLATVEIADRVLVVEAGRIVEDASPAELMASRSRYSELQRAWSAALT
ncbi:MAG: ABC transporter ATP-binding protein [Acidimicrobiales bacterium]